MQTATASFPWLSLLVGLPLLSSLLLGLLRPLAKYAKLIALGISLIVLAAYGVALWQNFDFSNGAQVQLYEVYPWISGIGASIAWGINGMGVLMIGLAVCLVPLVIVAEWNDHCPKTAGYFTWLLALESIMIGLFAARDVFLFYVLFEAMIVPMYFLIGRYGSAGRERAAMKFLLFSLLGGLLMLAGVISFYFLNGGGAQAYLLDLVPAGGIAASPSVSLWVFLSFFVAFAIKAPMWPLHTWLPDTAEKATAGTSTLLVGVLDKLGTYGMLVICLPLFPAVITKVAPIVIVLAIISIFWGAFLALGSDNLLRLVAYTSVSHFGFMVLGIFSGSQLAISGAILYMVAHGIGTAGLFFIVAFLGKRGNSVLISSYQGWQRVTPWLAGSFLIVGLATIALPGLSGFVPEYLVLMGTYQLYPVAALVAVVGVVVAALYILLPYQRIFTGPKPEVKVLDLDLREKLVMGVLILAMLGLGFCPNLVLDLINPIAEIAGTTLQQVSEIVTAGELDFTGSFFVAEGGVL